jgi:archaemetzincin
VSCSEPLPAPGLKTLPWYHFRLRTLLVLAAVCVPVVGLRVFVVPALVRQSSLVEGVDLPSQIRTPDNSKLPPQFRRLVSLHQPLGEPRPGDWLAHHLEAGQSYDEYLRFKPVRPTKGRRTIYIQPLGDFSPTQRKIVQLTAQYMGVFFQLPVRIRDDLPLSLIPEQARRKGSSYGDLQILSTYVLDKVLKPRLPADAVALTAFTTCDLWPGEGWNFVFGQASLKDRVGVWSMIRFGDPDHSQEALLLALRRTLATATHETGHMFSLAHCVFYECLMCGSNSLNEAERRPMWLCPQCLAKLCYATGANPEARFKALIGLAKTNGLKNEADFWQRSLEAMGEKR